MFLNVKGVQKTYGNKENQKTVLNNIQFSLNKGEICALLGPSGSGKSTLLNALGGLEVIEGGKIIINDQDISKLKNKKLTEYRRNNLGFIFQFYNLVPDLTVEENIKVGAYISKDPMDIDQLIVDLGLEEHKNKFPRQLSGGQQQRCAIGRALIKKPTLLLCDEPTGALDYKTSKDILALIQNINRDYQTTIVLATHNEALTQMCHRIIRLRDGEITSNQMNKNILDAGELSW